MEPQRGDSSLRSLCCRPFRALDLLGWLGSWGLRAQATCRIPFGARHRGERPFCSHRESGRMVPGESGRTRDEEPFDPAGAAAAARAPSSTLVRNRLGIAGRESHPYPDAADSYPGVTGPNCNGVAPYPDVAASYLDVACPYPGTDRPVSNAADPH